MKKNYVNVDERPVKKWVGTMNFTPKGTDGLSRVIFYSNSPILGFANYFEAYNKLKLKDFQKEFAVEYKRLYVNWGATTELKTTKSPQVYSYSYQWVTNMLERIPINVENADLIMKAMHLSFTKSMYFLTFSFRLETSTMQRQKYERNLFSFPEDSRFTFEDISKKLCDTEIYKVISSLRKGHYDFPIHLYLALTQAQIKVENIESFLYKIKYYLKHIPAPPPIPGAWKDKTKKIDLH